MVCTPQKPTPRARVGAIPAGPPGSTQSVVGVARRVRNVGGPPGSGSAREPRGKPSPGIRIMRHGRGNPATDVGRSLHEAADESERAHQGGRPAHTTGGRRSRGRQISPEDAAAGRAVDRGTGLTGRRRRHRQQGPGLTDRSPQAHRPAGSSRDGQAPRAGAGAHPRWEAQRGATPGRLACEPPRRRRRRRGRERAGRRAGRGRAYQPPGGATAADVRPRHTGQTARSPQRGRPAETSRDPGRGGHTAAVSGHAPPHRPRRAGVPAWSRGVAAPPGRRGRGGYPDAHAAMWARQLGGRSGSSGRRRRHRAGVDAPDGGGAPRGPSAAAVAQAMAHSRDPGHGRPGPASGDGDPARGKRCTNPCPCGPARCLGAVVRTGGHATLSRGGRSAQGRRRCRVGL
jgi:hypothetical protein